MSAIEPQYHIRCVLERDRSGFSLLSPEYHLCI